MKILTPCFIILSLFLTNLSTAQYTLGEAVNDTIYTGSFYSLDDNCFPDPDVTIELDVPLLSYVSGLDLKIIITELNAPEGSVSTEDGELSTGDTLAINTGTSYYSFYFTEGGDFNFIILATGIPEVESESYPCGLMEFISQPLCQVGYIIVADDYVGECVVKEGELVSAKDLALDLQFLCFPNPSNSIVNIQNNSQFPTQEITIRDGRGRKLAVFFDSTAFPFQIDLSAFPPGLYFIQIQSTEGQIIKKIVKV